MLREQTTQEGGIDTKRKKVQKKGTQDEKVAKEERKDDKEKVAGQKHQ